MMLAIKNIRIVLTAAVLISSLGLASAEEWNPVKKASVLYPKQMRDAAIANAEQYDWARSHRDGIVERAKPWYESTDGELWDMMFGPNITRAWMVWSDGYDPVSKKPVRMYDWKVDAWEHPWKVQSPHTGDLFPTNDFEAFYKSALDEHGVFQPERGDRSLLFNTEHPDPNDPLHTFCVDDGEGYTEDEKRWRFIGYYLKAGQWKQLVLGGINNLSQAYQVTGDPIYARKAGILLDRVADVYPLFDYYSQGDVYEKRGHHGFVTVWHDACEEVREMAQAYDMIFDAISKDPELVDFLSKKAEQYKLENPKDTFTKIQANIEDGIFRETLRREIGIRSNYPRTPIAVVTMKAVIEWPQNRDEVLNLISEILETSVKFDGLTGEEGLSGYTCIFPNSFASFIARFLNLDSTLLDDLYQRFPDMYLTYRFHIDTWCLDSFYPRVGDTGHFADRVRTYYGVAGNNADTHHFLWKLYELSGDPDFVKVMVHNNGGNVQGLGQSIFRDDQQEFQSGVQEVIDTHGTDIELGDVNKSEWGISILRSGEGDNRRAVWLDLDTDGRHSHRDALNIGLFTKGLDLLPDLGYPAVGYGGWGAPKAQWYMMSASHNTVVVDGKDSKRGMGSITLWGSGEAFHIMRVEAPQLIEGERFERTIALIDVSETDSYVFDLFRVQGGQDHAKFLGSLDGKVKTTDLNLSPSEDYGNNTQTRNFKTDANAGPGWSADWDVIDHDEKLTDTRDIHLRYTDLSEDVSASLAEAWIAAGLYSGGEAWIPRLMVRRTADSPGLSSRFMGIIEPYEDTPLIASFKKFSNNQDGAISEAIRMKLNDDREHIIACRPQESPIGVIKLPDIGLETDAQICFIAIRNQVIERVVLCHGKTLHFSDTIVRLPHTQPFIEIAIDDENARVTGNNPAAVASIQVKGKRLWIK